MTTDASAKAFLVHAPCRTLEEYRAAAAQAAPECIADGLDLGLLRQILRASRSGRPLPHATYNFLWTACATLLWLGTQPPRGELA